MQKYFLSITVCLTAFLLSAPVSQAASIDDPFGYFNVYSLGDINYSGSDFQGTTGAAKNVTTSSFTFYNLESNDYFLHAGETVSITGGSHLGSVESGSNMTLNNIGIQGNVYSGGSISGNGGSIYGNAYATGSYSLPVSTIKAPGTGAYTGQPYNPAVDLGVVSNYFSDFSNTVAGWGNTGSIAHNGFGAWTINASTGVNVFSIGALDLFNAHTFNVIGALDATVYINVTGGGAQSLNSTTWKFQGVSASDVLLNYSEATSLSMSGGNIINILAPDTDIDFSSGVLTGNLIAGNLGGHGQVNLGHFDKEIPMVVSMSSNAVPEPGTMLLLGAGFIVLIRLDIRKNNKIVS